MLRLEHAVGRLRELLGNWVHDTVNITRRKQAMGYLEDEPDEQEEREAGRASEQEEDEGPVYNPKNLPLGWDGKPIPYWLYKMHGLGIEYKCEICGNYSYWGRKAFERHFEEWRHSYGMKCLRIPNSSHFRDITLIGDALALHARLLQDSEQYRFVADREEEFEDQEGNPLTRKMRDDLRRQGLL
jgi:splicing factor 3A subunit 3